MRAPTQNFDSVEDMLICLKAEVPDNPLLDEATNRTYTWVARGELGRILPSFVNSFWSPFLYRGQVQRHSPCLPAVFRGLRFVDHPQKLSRFERAKCFLERVRLEEFLLALTSHPACDYSREIGLAMSPEAIAQHYEMATDRIDLSQDPDVAAFFATNTRGADGSWRPVSEGTGIVYRLKISKFRRKLREPSDLEWIGKQTLPRPGEQRAWTLRVPLGRDFEKLPVDLFTFTHRRHCSQRIHERFRGGKVLFPPDGLSRLAARIRAARSVARTFVSKVLTLQGCPAAIFERELQASVGYLAKHFSVVVRDRTPITFSPSQRAAIEKSVNRMKRIFLNDVGVRAVRTVMPEEMRRYRR